MNDRDFTQHGYHILQELGSNHLGGRTTYLAQKTNSEQQVVLKQFQFATTDSSWADYEAYEQEIAMLRHLNHPRIPRYLDSFPTSDGFCMVQEYLDARSLAIPRNWTPEEVRQVALAVLEILTYLQSQTTPVIHRDIKPENVLIDADDRVYLVDFGFARLGGGDIAASSVVKGTMGFMPPEQLFNRQLVKASDLYGLGATLICLLTGTKSADVGNLMDEEYRLHFRHLIPPLERGWLGWLEKLVEPRASDRYVDAQTALAALEPIQIDRLPKVRLGRDRLHFSASFWGEKVTESLTIVNPIPQTLLSGRWEVMPHPNDPPHTAYDHAWIAFDPMKFEGNDVECKITVDTGHLCANQVYSRQIRLQTNADAESSFVTLEVQTAPLVQSGNKLGLASVPRLVFMVLFALAGWFAIGVQQSNDSGVILVCILTFAVVSASPLLESLKLPNRFRNFHEETYWGKLLKFVIPTLGGSVLFGLAAAVSQVVSPLVGVQIGAIGGALWPGNFREQPKPIESKQASLQKRSKKHLKIAFFSIILIGLVILISAVYGAYPVLIFISSASNPVFIAVVCLGIFLGAFYVPSYLYILGFKMFAIPLIKNQSKQGFTQSEIKKVLLSVSAFSFCLGLSARLGLWPFFPTSETQSLNVYLIGAIVTAALAATGIPLFNFILKPSRQIARYQRLKSQLIKS